MANELSRRSFMKVLAVTSAAAAGCTDLPSRQLMPYVIPDENVIPGVPSFYTGTVSYTHLTLPTIYSV